MNSHAIERWLLLSATGKPIPFFGLELPALIGKAVTSHLKSKRYTSFWARPGIT